MKLCFLLVSLWACNVIEVTLSERCDDWGEDLTKKVQVYNGEPGRIKCPLFQDFERYSYSTAHSAGLTLMWYWIGQGKDLEEPINIRLPEGRISKRNDTLWFRPAVLNDTGNYTCMLRNTTYCKKVAVPLEVIEKDPNSCKSQQAKVERVELPSDNLGILNCLDIEGFYPSTVTPDVAWYMNCSLVDNFAERFVQGTTLTFSMTRLRYEGNYTCIVTYEDNGKRYNLTRTAAVKVVGSPYNAKPPVILLPNNMTTYEFEAGQQAQLQCEVSFSFVKNSRTDVWWTIDGKNVDDIADPKINVTESVQEDAYGNKVIREVLIIKDVTAEVLKRSYTCYAKNTLGETSQQALVKLKAVTPRYITELACGLGATLVLVLVLITVYHVYWLEIVLFYRAHFGTDETIGDGKEYDVYVSYARNAEEEEFVLLTLRGVLENEFGYKLCIFDRDSLPGGIITDETLTFVKKSRRLLVVLSPNYVLQGTQALLELKAGLENMASKGSIKVILVQYRPIKNSRKVKELKRAQAVLTIIKWKGEKSKYPGGRFWKQLHVVLPVKKPSKSSTKKIGAPEGKLCP
ncbi:interleukin-1 receptor accessory protein isoform X2 [Microcaecilia unicolor]|uniref:Interleukin-1 receptor accessory protein isoform X2 n=1 Tax=Microcaecilia unicolor TaxID=1415580 RepID=A0A6P7Z7L0_9AMPH|nr:interleukin-1 receptor accessory protein isoform X2 [Microcaecilia unicolor]